MNAPLIALVVLMSLAYGCMFMALGWVYIELFKWHKDLEERKRNRKG